MYHVWVIRRTQSRAITNACVSGTHVAQLFHRLRNCFIKIMTEKLSGFDFWQQTLNSCQYVVAPMVDQSELAWRILSRRYGAQLCFSPMYHASVFVRDAGYRRDALQSCTEDRPLIIQFCANDPDTFLAAAKLAENHCDAIDLNLGCPQMIARRGHYGAFLQDEWELLKKMVSICHANLKVPITCKIRVFESIEKTVQYAQMLEKAGCQLLTVHGRTKEQKGRLTGIADWKYVTEISKKLKIPVFSNGNIQYLSDVTRCIEETGVQGVMTAEGNLHNPALFSGLSPPVWEMVDEYLDLAEKYPCPLSYARGHVFKLLHHALHLHQDVRDIVARGNSLSSFREASAILRERCQAEMKLKDFNPRMGLFGELPLPYWYCQPYVRPSEEEAERNREKRDILKRPLEITERMKEEEGMSKKKIKKRLRNPNKNFDKNNKVVYQICVNDSCSNPRGLKCNYSLCKICCRKKTSEEIIDCIGHFIKFKPRPGQGSTDEKQPESVPYKAGDIRNQCNGISSTDSNTTSVNVQTYVRASEPDDQNEDGCSLSAISGSRQLSESATPDMCNGVSSDTKTGVTKCTQSNETVITNHESVSTGTTGVNMAGT